MNIISTPLNALIAKHVAEKPYLPFWQLVCIGLAVVAMVSGKYSLARLYDIDLETHFLEVRFIAAVLCLIVMLFQRRNLNDIAVGQPSLYVSLGALAGYYVFCVILYLFYWDTAGPYEHIIDAIYLLVFVYLMLRLLRSEADLTALAFFIEAIALMFALAYIFSAESGLVDRALVGEQQARFLTPATFYRIEFVGFCCAVFLLFTTDSRVFHVLHGAAAVILLFSTFASLSKSAFLFGLLVPSIWAFVLVVMSRYGRVMVLAIVVGLALLAFTMSERSATLFQRVAAMGTLQMPGAEILKQAPLNRAECREMLSEFTDDPEMLTQVDQYSCNRVFMVVDNSVRIRLLMKAMNMFDSAPWFGHGLGSYSLVARNRYFPALDVYKYPHNVLLGSLAETGLVGTAFVLVSLIAGCILLVRAILRAEVSMYIGGISLFALFTSTVSGDMYDARLFWVAASAVTAVYIVSGRHSRPNDSPDLPTRRAQN